MRAYDVTRPWDNSDRVRRIRRQRDMPHKLLELFGDDYCGNASAPGDNMALRVRDDENDLTHVYRVGDDACTLWIGYHDEWKWFMSAKEARAAARFILWHWWIKREWFGLRRWLWMKALHAAVERARQMLGPGA